MQQFTIQLKEYCEPSFPLLDGRALFIGLNKTMLGRRINDESDAEFVAIDVASKEIVWRYQFDTSVRKKQDVESPNEVIARPVIWNDRIIIASKYELACLDKNNGKKIWSILFKDIADTKVSVFDHQLYYTNGNVLYRADVETGKSLEKKKYRVKWLDSALVSYQSRSFIATASSKIIEVTADTLEVMNEFPYSGNWAIGETPFFFEELMISSSYAGEVNAFDLRTNQHAWKLAKKAGAAPLQFPYQGSVLLYDGHPDLRLRRVEIKDKKTTWSKDLGNVQALSVRNAGEFMAVYKSGADTFNLAVFDFNSGELKEHVTDNGPSWKEYPYGLWDGISVEENENYIVSNFKPNEIFVLQK